MFGTIIFILVEDNVLTVMIHDVVACVDCANVLFLLFCCFPLLRFHVN